MLFFRAEYTKALVLGIVCGMQDNTPKIDVRALSALARINITDEEVVALEKELPEILGFVDEIQSAHAAAPSSVPFLHNVMRPDEKPYESGTFTDRLLAVAPAVKNGYIKVKQVLSRK